ncbi:MAG: class I SAM-dependent methyltransferase [Candidatus Eisenbacteria bacterium]
MSQESVNRTTYERRKIVDLYCSGPIQLAELNFLVKYKDEFWGKRVLDLGCGAGRTTEFMRPFDVEYTGVDYSESMIGQCMARFPDARCMHCDARNMDCFESGSFDFVLFSNNGLDSLTHEDRMRALREVNRVLADGGVFAFSTHNRDYRLARSEPSLELSWDPSLQARALIRFVRRWYNRRRNRRLERFEDDYWILNDSSHLYSLVTHYVRVPTQVRQLSELGFETLEAFGRDGMPLSLDAEDRDSSWIYYVARKIAPAPA